MSSKLAMRAGLLVVCGVLAACSSADSEATTTTTSAASSTTAAGGTTTSVGDTTTTPELTDEPSLVNIYAFQEPNRFSPLDPRRGGDLVARTLIYDNLISVNADQEPIPRLAESWDFQDATTLTFNLRSDLLWSDGEPLTSSDVLFTYNLLANPASGSASSGTFASVVGAKDVVDGTAETVAGFSAPDPTTFVIELAGPNPGFVAQLAGPEYQILPEHVLGDTPVEGLVDDPFFNAPSVSSGPFTFVEFRPGQYLELAANQNYWKDVGIDRLFLHTVTSDVAIAQLATGEIDITRVTPQDVSELEAAGGVTVLSALNPGYERMSVNLENPRLTRGVRQAMAFGINRESIVNDLFGGQGTVVNSAFLVDGDRPDDLEDYSYDPDRAAELLESEGWDSSAPIRAMYLAGNRDREQVLQVVQAQLAEVGMTVELMPLQAAEYVENLGDPTSWDLVLYGGGNYSIDSSTVAPILACDGFFPDGANIPHYCNEELDAIMAEAATESDPEARRELYQQAAAIENEDIPMIWMYRPVELWAHGDRVDGFNPNGDRALVYWNVADWTISE
jgi:ABC-type transport system substrate-binding protein